MFTLVYFKTFHSIKCGSSILYLYFYYLSHFPFLPQMCYKVPDFRNEKQNSNFNKEHISAIKKELLEYSNEEV